MLATVLVEATTHFSEGATTTDPDRNASLDAFHFAFFVGSCLIMVSALAALMIHDRDAANTMRGYVASEPLPEDIIGIE